MDYNKKANEILVELFYENWMTKTDLERFKKKCVTICGYGDIALSMDLQSSFQSHTNISNRLDDIKKRVSLN